MNKPTNDEIRQNVRKHYQQIAVKEVNPPAVGSCCGAPSDVDALSSQMGYSTDELTAVPQGANLGLGCGNPQAIAELKIGEIVLDLGSGGGFDCFLASRQVGENGKVIGVDMTPDMVSRARSNAAKGNFTNTDFRLGEIEHLPVADGTVDVIISNCVINLSPDKQQVFNEAFRVLKSGGRLAISDIVTTAELPSEIKNDLNELYSGCISGASSLEEVKSMLLQSGFMSINIEPKDESKSFIKDWVPGANVDNYIVSAIIKAKKA
ncbi:arsenite methyltransferase [Paenibacillus polymyxa]|uniref:arsenite methyltransferase n=1 Tax=Paenibacillus polymyxa TaxID=1406 RepID=UPI000589F26F|nr:arsenite methyltransferase [Paenibacillus polymyxa]AJE52702.1 arsenite S-adenosylmethyltransferase [Paenibacillus polymyxa]QOH63467.1 methyltransferase domain-containing protein [Paenibacillus polymyxa]